MPGSAGLEEVLAAIALGRADRHAVGRVVGGAETEVVGLQFAVALCRRQRFTILIPALAAEMELHARRGQQVALVAAINEHLGGNLDPLAGRTEARRSDSVALHLHRNQGQVPPHRDAGLPGQHLLQHELIHLGFAKNPLVTVPGLRRIRAVGRHVVRLHPATEFQEAAGERLRRVVIGVRQSAGQQAAQMRGRLDQQHGPAGFRRGQRRRDAARRGAVDTDRRLRIRGVQGEGRGEGEQDGAHATPEPAAQALQRRIARTIHAPSCGQPAYGAGSQVIRPSASRR